MQVALWMRQFYEVSIVGKETLMICSAVLTVRCRVLRSETAQFPYHMVRQLARMLSRPSIEDCQNGRGSLALLSLCSKWRH